MAEFQHDLFGCFDNMEVCILTYFVPCYVVGQTAESVGDSFVTCCIGYMFLGCIAGGIVRGKVRALKGIEGSGCGDCCIHMWCPLCAVAQDRMETMDGPGAGGQAMARV